MQEQSRLEQIEAHIRYYRLNEAKVHNASLPAETRAEARKRAGMHMRYASRLCQELSMEGVTDAVPASATI